MKILTVGAMLFHVDRETNGQTDMTQLIVAFYNSVNLPENEILLTLFTATQTPVIYTSL
jgi:hypothetical protein